MQNIYDETNNPLEVFKGEVATKFQLYNSFFSSLPFHTIEKTGILLSMLLLSCEEDYKENKSPIDIISDFCAKQTNFKENEEKVNFLFKIIQYIERQVVLFDSLEDAAFAKIHDIKGHGTMHQLMWEVDNNNKIEALKERLNDFSIQLVLTAHPTQFYRDAVLGIMHHMSNAVVENKEKEIYSYLKQLGRTAFFQKNKPTPYDEAISLIWYLENVFYKAVGNIISFLKSYYPNIIEKKNHCLINMGFWPGGDRDGNPFVSATITLQVAQALHKSIIKCYYKDILLLKERLTFKLVEDKIIALEVKLRQQVYGDDKGYGSITPKTLLTVLEDIKNIIQQYYDGLFVADVISLINKVQLFGFHFATLDIRQDRDIHTHIYKNLAGKVRCVPENYSSLSEQEKIAILLKCSICSPQSLLMDAVEKDTLEVIQTIQTIQTLNGERGCHRYIISQCNSVVNIIEVIGLFLMSGWDKDDLQVDIIPLFEMIDDLHNAASIMQQLYDIPFYKEHLKKRNNCQTVMLGFSDGTKDGGYLMGNWSIYKAKEELTSISNKVGIEVVFFDGRGGPPARGGGKTHKFYASMGKNISSKEIQLTIQGQTVSSNFGTITTAQYNIEQMLHAGMYNHVLSTQENTLTQQERQLLQQLADWSYDAYKALKNHPNFPTYLYDVTPIRFYAEANIGSRPTKRKQNGEEFSLKDIRAIPFVGSLSQIKQNISGFYGVGTALEKMYQYNQWDFVKLFYTRSLFFRTLLDNCEMAMKKSFFPLTAYLKNHPTYQEVWNMIYQEFEKTKKYILLIEERTDLMESYPIDKLSIEMRERVVLPLVTIQQYALQQIRDMQGENLQRDKLLYQEKLQALVIRASFGIINASRNSA